MAPDAPRDSLPADHAAAISLGSNLGPGQELFLAALRGIDALPMARVIAVSSLYRTPPWGDTDQPDFLNAVALLEWRTTADELLRVLLEQERSLGRARDKARRWGPRTIDLDLLWCGQERRSDAHLTLPHPRLAERRFVLEPLAELGQIMEADWIVPGLGAVSALLADCPGEGSLSRLEGPTWWSGSAP